MLYLGYLIISFYKTCYKITHQSVEEKMWTLCQIGQPLWKLENVLDLGKSISAAVRLEGHACVCTCLCMRACVSGVCLYHAVALRWTALRWWITHYGDWFCLLPAIALPVEYEQPALLQPFSLTYTVQMMGRINCSEKMEAEHFGEGLVI